MLTMLSNKYVRYSLLKHLSYRENIEQIAVYAICKVSQLYIVVKMFLWVLFFFCEHRERSYSAYCAQFGACRSYSFSEGPIRIKITRPVFSIQRLATQAASWSESGRLSPIGCVLIASESCLPVHLKQSYVTIMHAAYCLLIFAR